MAEPAPSAVFDPCRPLTDLRGVGPERVRQLARLGCQVAGDLLWLRPRRYEDRRALLPIAQLTLEREATVRGRVVDLGVSWYQQRRKSVFDLVLDDGTARLHCRWWNQPYLEKNFERGMELMAHGLPVQLQPRTMNQPEIERVELGVEETIHLNRVVPIYPLTEGLSQRWLRRLMHEVILGHTIALPELWPGVDFGALPSRADALRWLHFPDEPGQPELARQRFALEEFITFQCELRARRQRLEASAAAPPCPGDNRWVKPWLAQLGFALTTAQTRVLREIRQDLAQTIPMRRLLQGDVGSGKTAVACAAALMALESGWNVLLMAPTEILAGQHFLTFTRWLEPLGIPVKLHTGARKDLPGQPDPVTPAPMLVIGTHALIEQKFGLERVGLVIIDEQHRFGVSQRQKLLRKGRHPHLLVMTATPIPRTLGLTLYGDLDCSVLDEKPPGRGQIRTHVRGEDRLPKVWEFVRQQLDAGRQAYVVYPLVEEPENRELKAATQEFERLKSMLAPHPVGMVHGRLPAEEKAEAMRRFRAGESRVLVATSVIEVGVDVANATVMVIENAGQFGLAQLHQLRGRIGRGGQDSHCILVAHNTTEAALERLEVLVESNDGFRIAEADLRLRGPGEFLGRSQSGRAHFRFGDLARDLRWLEQARQVARQLTCSGASSGAPTRAK